MGLVTKFPFRWILRCPLGLIRDIKYTRAPITSASDIPHSVAHPVWSHLAWWTLLGRDAEERRGSKQIEGEEMEMGSDEEDRDAEAGFGGLLSQG